jgi:hypothetical protein
VLAPTFTVIVDAPPAVTDAGLKLTVVPAGWPLALKVTVGAGPVMTAVPIVDVPLPPCWMLRLVGLAVIEKSDGGAAVTVNATAVVRVALAPVPVTVTVYVPGVVLPPTFTVIVEELPAVMVVGLNAIVTPAGWPVALSVTLCVAPAVTAVAIVDVPLAPCWMLRLDGFALIEKSDAVTVSPTVVVCVTLAPVPVTVIV